MNKQRRRMLIMMCAAVIVVSAVMLLYQNGQYKKGAETYEKASQLAAVPAEATKTPEYDPCAKINLPAIQKENADVQGWIVIPDTNVSYPLLYSSDREPTYYLSHAWDTSDSTVGAIFIEPENAPGLTDFNTVIYGHNMKDGSMFGTLSNYCSADWWQEHKKLYILTEAGSECYDIFAAYEVSTEGKTYQIGFSSDEKKQEFLDFCTQQSIIDTGITPTINDRIITLSTCTGHGHATRWVVQAVSHSGQQ